MLRGLSSFGRDRRHLIKPCCLTTSLALAAGDVCLAAARGCGAVAAACPHPAVGAERGYGTAEPPAPLSHVGLLRTQNCVRCSCWHPTLYLDVKGCKSDLPVSA